MDAETTLTTAPGSAVGDHQNTLTDPSESRSRAGHTRA
jgi:hypothetical protein